MRTSAIFGFLVTPLLVILAGDAALAEGPSVGERIDEAVQLKTRGGFWGAILVAKGGEVLLSKGYGFADYRGRPNTPETLFEIASASKQFTAAAILRLEQDGKLSTSDTLSTFFPDVPKDKSEITVHQLMTHTSGLSPSVGIPYSSPISREDFAKHVFAAPLACEPGTRFAYNNPAYALLAGIVEVASKQSFRQYMHEALFKPAGLSDTGLIGDEKLIASGRAAKRIGEGPPEWSAANWHWGFGYKGMGGVVSTTGDILKWDRVLRGDTVLGAKAREKLFTPVLSGYACGWMVSTTARGTTRVEHGGMVMGFACHIVRLIEEDTVIVLLSNDRRDLRQVVTTITDILFPPPRIEVDIDATDLALSSYRAGKMSANAAWAIERDGDRLVLRLVDGGRTPAVIRMPVSSATKVLSDLDAAIAVRRRSDPEAPEAMESGLYLGPYGEQVTFTLTEKLAIVVRPKYVGRDASGARVEDPRVLLYVKDSQYRQWPVMVKMNVAAAESFAGQLRQASGGKPRR